MGVTDDLDPELAEVRQHELADGCDTTIVTEAAPAIFANGGARLREASDLVFKNRPTRYDLLSAPSLKLLTQRQEWLDLLAGDVLMTVGLHRVEKVLVATATAPHQIFIRQLRQTPDIRRTLSMGGVTLPQAADHGHAGTMALTCMDWRLHGPGGFGSYFAKLYDTGRFSVFGTAGAAKELAHEGVRSDMVFAQIALLKGRTDRMVLVSHTDCGRYGGARAFAGPDAELRRLAADLAAAKHRVETAFPWLTVKTAIARTRGNRCLGVTPIGA
ncbi:MAG TPA: hypothetical protein VL500_03510 [Candidatus Eisenbacteria bacterium]|nr:hypothetical protein [Candidatus Eisenbacteria bacterium]